MTDVWDITFPAYQIADVLGWGGLPTSAARTSRSNRPTTQPRNWL